MRPLCQTVRVLAISWLQVHLEVERLFGVHLPYIVHNGGVGLFATDVKESHPKPDRFQSKVFT